MGKKTKINLSETSSSNNKMELEIIFGKRLKKEWKINQMVAVLELSSCVSVLKLQLPIFRKISIVMRKNRDSLIFNPINLFKT